MKYKQKTLILSILVFNLMFISGMYGVSDICTTKVDSNKKLSTSSFQDTHILEWNFTWGGDYHVCSYAINYDSLGNVYIAGRTNDAFTGDDDIFLAKFNSSGHFQWNQTWGEDGDDIIMDIVIDSLNNIYMAGSIVIGSDYFKLLLVKYDSMGNYQWNRTWGGSLYDGCYGIALDSAENIYLVGYTHNFTATQDVCLVKFNSHGQYQWNRTWGGGFRDGGYDIEIDSSDNIYITGNYEREFNDMDVCLIKYNYLGVYQWNRTFDLSSYDIGSALTLDSTNNIYISGVTSNSSYLDGFLVFLKYDNNGTLIREEIWGEPGLNMFSDMASDSEDNIYMVGFVDYSTLTNLDFCLIQFNTNGVEQFVHKWGSSGLDGYYGLTIDSSDNLYLTGIKNYNEVYLEKYSKRDTPLNGKPSDNMISFGNIYLIFSIFGIAFLITIEQRRKKK